MGDGMPPKTRYPPGRFDIIEATGRIRDLMRARGVKPPAIYERLGMHRRTWSKKINLTGSEFTLNELGLIADALDAPTGWPILDRLTGEAIDRQLGIVRSAVTERPAAKPGDSLK